MSDDEYTGVEENTAYLKGFNDGANKERERWKSAVEERIAELGEQKDGYETSTADLIMGGKIEELERLRDTITEQVEVGSE